MPAFPSLDALNWRLAIDRILAERQATAKVLAYEHWQDPQVRHALERCDGAFIYPIAQDIPDRLLELLRSRRAVVLDQDYTAHGIPSICPTAEAAIDVLLDHVAGLGLGPIACINVQPHDACIRGRIARWQAWGARHGWTGSLIDRPVRLHTHPSAAARDVAQGCPLVERAVFATTATGAIGINRGFADRGLRVGRDVALCTLNGEGIAELSVPSITCIRAPEPDPWLRQALLWMEEPENRPWQGPLAAGPSSHAIAPGESTQMLAV